MVTGSSLRRGFKQKPPPTVLMLDHFLPALQQQAPQPKSKGIHFIRHLSAHLMETSGSRSVRFGHFHSLVDNLCIHLMEMFKPLPTRYQKGIRAVHKLCDACCLSGFDELQDASRKKRAFRLTDSYEALVSGNG